MAAGVEELAVSINILSDNARSTDSSVRETRELASQGREASGAAVSQMANIEQAVADAAGQIEHLGEASRQISSVVSVIREVADQTNLLALNAAIEAARAGEQGRGFAVVADEVRKLAERTAASTQEISRVVDSIQSGAGEAIAGMHAARGRVGEGVVKVEDSGARMAAIESGAAAWRPSPVTCRTPSPSRPAPATPSARRWSASAACRSRTTRPPRRPSRPPPGSNSWPAAWRNPSPASASRPEALAPQLEALAPRKR
jgi:hypothetical protein